MFEKIIEVCTRLQCYKCLKESYEISENDLIFWKVTPEIKQKNMICILDWGGKLQTHNLWVIVKFKQENDFYGIETNVL